MAWNEPGEKDPWRGRKDQEPPDLEQMVAQFFKRLFGGSGSGSNASGSGGAANGQYTKHIVVGVVLVFVAVWALSGIFIIQPAEQGVVLRFGRYVTTFSAGPHWIPRFIESVKVRDTKKLSKFTYNAQMLTKKANIVVVAITVQYRIDNLKNYLYNNRDPEDTLFHGAASALRQVVGHTDLDSVMTSGRILVRQQTQELLEKTLAKYKMGIEIKEVTLQSARAPEQVRDAFNEAIKAGEIEQKYINEAKAYRSAVVPKAKGEAQRLIADAEAYKTQVTLKASGDVARFNALLPQFLSAPRVTRERMYLDTLESVFSKSSKVLVDTKGSNNLLYLPIDKLMQHVATSDKASSAESASPVQMKLGKADESEPSEIRSRYEHGRRIYRGRGES